MKYSIKPSAKQDLTPLVVEGKSANQDLTPSVLPITPAIAARAVGLHAHHSDPQDRIIIATALAHGAKLMSDDGKFVKYVELKDRLL